MKGTHYSSAILLAVSLCLWSSFCAWAPPLSSRTLSSLTGADWAVSSSPSGNTSAPCLVLKKHQVNGADKLDEEQ